MNIVIAADPCAVPLKNIIIKYLEEKGHKTFDHGATETDPITYYESAVAASKAMQAGEGERGVFICGTGMGMNIIANRFKGIRASVVESAQAAKLCRAINDSNVLCIGAMLCGEWVAKDAIDAFLSTNVGDGLPDIADFLKKAVKEVEKINP